MNELFIDKLAEMKGASVFDSKAVRYGVALSSVLLLTIGLESLGERINATTVALAYLLIVLSAATFFGRNPALLASLGSMLAFNYLFLPPVGTWHIADPQNLIAWAAFTITAIVAGELSEYARRRSRESKRLLDELNATLAVKAEAEALRQSEKLKSALLDAVTHDLRTPLTSIKAAVTTLMDSEGGHRTIVLDSGGRAEFLDIINEEADRLNRFIESMVALARVEAGSTNAARSTARIEEIVSDAVERAAAIAEGHLVKVHLEDDLPPVNADGGAVGEVIYNLIENAVKYSPVGTNIAIASRRRGNRIEVTVNDEGIGIPEAMREKVFEKFVRLNDKSASGMGLGLAIARGIIEAQDGSIEIVDGDNGVGTKVRLTVPIETT